jgi:hypothetical protein
VIGAAAICHPDRYRRMVNTTWTASGRARSPRALATYTVRTWPLPRTRAIRGVRANTARAPAAVVAKDR